MDELGKSTTTRSRSAFGHRAAVAGMLGTMIEAYDFTVYAYLVIYTAPAFFPRGDPATSILASLAVFAVGFISRPLGGIFFGRIGDRRGRRFTLLVTVTLMGIATFALGAIPDHATIGIWAPVLLVTVRLAQGFSAGGEVIGSATYVVESSTPGRRGLYSSATPLGAVFAVALAPIVVGLCIAIVGAQQMGEWGWRIPFLLAIPLTVICLVFRLRIQDSPEYLTLVRQHEVVKAPLREVLSYHWRSVIAVAVLAISIFFVSYTLTAYVPTFLSSTVGLPPGTVYWLTATAVVLAAPTVILSGLAVDRFGRRKVLIASLVICTVLIYPGMTVMTGAGSSTLGVGIAYWLLLCTAFAANPPAYQAFCDLFPARIRYTGAAVGFNIGNVIGGGFGPYFSAQLIQWTRNPQSPALLVAFAAFVGVGTILLTSRMAVAKRAGALPDVEVEPAI